MQKSGSFFWEIAVPNGLYRVSLTMGDPKYTSQLNIVNIEGYVAHDYGNDNFDTHQATISVLDGRITVKPAERADNAKLSFIEIVQIGGPSTIDLEPVWVRVGDSYGAEDEDNGTASIEAAEFSPDGNRIVSGAKRGGEVHLWNLSGNKVWSNPRYHNGNNEIEVVTFTKDNQYAVTGAEDGYIRVWRVSDRAQVKSLALSGGGGVNVGFDGMRFSNDGSRLATGDEYGRISLWDTSNSNPANWPSNPIITIYHGPDRDCNVSGCPSSSSGDEADINSLDWTQNDQFLLSASRNGTVKRWEVAAMSGSNGGLRQTYTGFNDSIKTVRVSGNYVAGGGQNSPDALVLVWNLTSGTLVKRIDYPDYDTFYKIEAVEFTPDGNYLLSGGLQGKDGSSGYPGNRGVGNINIYDVQDNFSLEHVEPTFRQEYFDFNTNGTKMVSSHEDGTVRLWNVVTP